MRTVPSADCVHHVLLRRLVALVALTILFSGCSAEYYARRQARREQRLALREARQQARQAEEDERMFQRCTNPQLAFEEGNNDGLGHRPMSSDWVAQCPPEYQAQQYESYTAGYQQGASLGRQVVVVGPSVGSSSQVYVSGTGGTVSCRFSSDCGGSAMSCRDWGGMGHVCMGQGYAGAPCWFGSDCLSNRCDGVGQSRTCR